PSTWRPLSSSRGMSMRGGRTRTQRLTATNRVLCGVLIVVFLIGSHARAQEPPPELTQPVNDFANVIDTQSAQTMEAMIRSLQQASGDVVVVATVPTFKPYGDIREYAVKMFENRGR